MNTRHRATGVGPLTRSCLATLALLPGVPASAQDKPIYVGAAAARSQFEVECPGASCEDPSNTGGRLYAGWNFHSVLGAELSYANYGAAETDVVSPTVRTRARLDVQALALALTARYRFNNFTLLGRAGVARVSSEKTGAGLSSSGSRGSTEFVYGIAGEWSFAPGWSVRADIERQRVGYVGQSGDINSLALGINYRF